MHVFACQNECLWHATIKACHIHTICKYKFIKATYGCVKGRKLFLTLWVLRNGSNYHQMVKPLQEISKVKVFFMVVPWV
jgi:hypothetical protein